MMSDERLVKNSKERGQTYILDITTAVSFLPVPGADNGPP